MGFKGFRIWDGRSVSAGGQVGQKLLQEVAGKEGLVTSTGCQNPNPETPKPKNPQPETLNPETLNP